jgi:hypothetical protein
MALKIDEQATAAWKSVRNDASDTNWVAISYETSDYLKLLGSGSGGYEEFLNILTDDQMIYAAFRVFGVTGSGLDAKRTKFVGVSWIGPKVKTMVRARGTIHKTHVDRFFDGLHISIAATTKEDIDKETIIKKLNAVSGAHKVEGYEF